MKELLNEHLTGERALFQTDGLKIINTTFEKGTHPLKHSRYVEVEDSKIDCRYPMWYSEKLKLKNTVIGENGIAAIWYGEEINVTDTTINAPKSFRRCQVVNLRNVNITNGDETLWKTQNIRLSNVKVKGSYFGMDSDGVEITGLELRGDHAFDGVRNATIRGSFIMSENAFWNCENIVVFDSRISGNCIGWNSRNVKFVNCTIESHQGMCFVKDLVLEKCTLPNTDLAFEYSNISANIIGSINSIKNPKGGIIKADYIGEIIMESENVDINKTKIICGNE